MLSVLNHAAMITGFVTVMMLCVEYLNVLTGGAWQRRLANRPFGQYLLAAALGLTPGCLGAFAVVAMYSHRVVTIGAVVTAMIVTSGDEAFVMLALIPREAVALSVLLLPVGGAAGVLVDRVVTTFDVRLKYCDQELAVHQDEACDCFPRGGVRELWRDRSWTRLAFLGLLVAFIASIAGGMIGPGDWTWSRVTVLATSGLALGVVATVPKHFLREHLWNHVVRAHLPRVFFWSLAALSAIELIADLHPFEAPTGSGSWLLLGIASLVGLVPESGPHLIFVTLYADGLAPFSVLLASSIVQDGHGMLPMLAHSKRVFFWVKVVNLGVGLVVGGIALLFGF